MKNHIIMMVTIIIAVLLPELAHASVGVIMFDIGGLGCTGSVFESDCATNPDQGLFSSIACKVMKAINTGIIPVYCNIVGNPNYTYAITGVMSLYVSLWGLLAVAGMTQVTMGQAFIKLLKVMFVFALVTNASFYFQFVYSFVMNAPQEVVEVMLASAGHGGQNFFEYVDTTSFEMINSIIKPEVTDEKGASYQAYDLRIIMLAAAAWKLIPGIGPYIYSIFFFTLLSWLFAFASIVVRYLLALLVLNFLLVLGPIFLPTILFEKSKFLGDEWIKMLVSYMVQIVVVIAFVLMVEDIYKEFTDLIKTGINETIPGESYKETSKPYAVPISEDTMSVEKIVSFDGEKYVTSVDGGKFATKEDFMKWFFLELIKMALISVLTLVFMKDYVPMIAVALGGNLKFVSVFGSASTPNLWAQGKADARPEMFGPSGAGRPPKTENSNINAGDRDVGGGTP